MTSMTEDLALFRKLEEEARFGDARAQFNLAECLFEGRGTLRDREAAIELFRKSAEAGFEPAMKRLGPLLAKMTDDSSRHREGVEWIRKLAERGDPDMLLPAAGVLPDVASPAPGEEDRSSLRPEQVSWLEQAAERGNVLAMSLLAENDDPNYLGKGKRLESFKLSLTERPDHLEVRRFWAERAAAGGDCEGQFLLGRILLKDDDWNTRRTGVGWLEKAALGGSIRGAAALAELYFDEPQAIDSRPMAQLYAQQAIRLFRNTDWKRVPRRRSTTKFREEADKFYVTALYVLGRTLTETSRNPSEAIPWLEEAAEIGLKHDDPLDVPNGKRALLFLATEAAFDEKLRFPFERAVHWCKRAIWKKASPGIQIDPGGYPAIKLALGKMYRMGLGTERDPQQAFSLYSDGLSAKTITNLSNMTQTSRDNWVSLVCEGIRETGRALLFGDGTGRNESLAHRNLLAAAALGDATALRWARRLPYPPQPAIGRPNEWPDGPEDWITGFAKAELAVLAGLPGSAGELEKLTSFFSEKQLANRWLNEVKNGLDKGNGPEVANKD